MKFDLWKVFCYDVKTAWYRLWHDGIALVLMGLWWMCGYLYNMTLGALYSVYVCHKANKNHPPTDEKYWRSMASATTSVVQVPVDKETQS